MFRMYDFFEKDTSVKCYLISGQAMKSMRQKLKIGFNDFCFRASISSHTLARIEKQEGTIIKSATMERILIGFNICRRGLRKNLVIPEQLVFGKYRTYHREFVDCNIVPRRATIYLNASLTIWINTYAKQNNITKNKAITEILKNYFGIDEEKLQYRKIQSSHFQTLGHGAL